MELLCKCSVTYEMRNRVSKLGVELTDKTLDEPVAVDGILDYLLHGLTDGQEVLILLILKTRFRLYVKKTHTEFIHIDNFFFFLIIGGGNALTTRASTLQWFDNRNFFHAYPSKNVLDMYTHKHTVGAVNIHSTKAPSYRRRDFRAAREHVALQLKHTQVDVGGRGGGLDESHHLQRLHDVLVLLLSVVSNQAVRIAVRRQDA